MKNFRIILIIGGLLFINYSCKNNNSKPLDTPTSGEITIAVDETLQPIIEAELPVFHAIYKSAHINVKYIPEQQAIDALFKDSLGLCVMTRPLSENEKSYFNNKKLYPREVKIAFDAIALITHPSNPDSLLTIDQISQMLSGKITQWSELNNNSSLGNIDIVFDNEKSSIVRFFSDSIIHAKKLSGHAVTKNADVIDYVSENPNALGLIGVSWISNNRDPKCLSFLSKINVVAVSKSNVANEYNSFKPFQAYIATGDYPFRRLIYMVLTEPRNGLASGFTSFVANDKGQRIILKTGILPYTQTIRIVNVNEEQ